MCDGQRLNDKPAAHACACGGHAPAKAGRTVDASTDLVLPAVTFPARVLEVAGEEKLRQAVRRHHQRLLATPIAALFPADEAQFAVLVERVADFFVEACGGDSGYTERNGKMCMRTRHFPFTVDEASREIWLEQLFLTLDEVDFPVEVRDEYWTWLEAFSVRMINRRTMRGQPARIPYVAAQSRFGAACAAPQ
jgi:hemoglobin